MAAGCSNTHSQGVSLFTFPREVKLKKQWIREVKKTRDKWQGPSESSVLCSDHFTEDSFDSATLLEAQFGLLKKRKLKPGAVPTLFKKPEALLRKRAGSTQDLEVPAPKRREGAYEKRERSRVSYWCIARCMYVRELYLTFR